MNRCIHGSYTYSTKPRCVWKTLYPRIAQSQGHEVKMLIRNEISCHKEYTSELLKKKKKKKLKVCQPPNAMP